ncbi:HK97-gp10 family putative phage morphogenesis protein [Limosilactobacillus fastidiosus]|uniref:HK97 gp10 family phage protein n=1 Tax=Limosilactobacillus fastidiosus TaxID=2759855 RepID=A0A7W3U018_9LACO|nr:HK97-gp10 family putative phage morphogenesis protein [Limosilactobacillus fastidiosus]MBB1086374.1 hypothetical protein [Limosilactobacillus fastidiosus]MCD7086251.1 hypothetical protein [Limosilactobacillus fastidiosus]MCD7115014.1 hypothetical protein [Limosilactobacillus fastidiosus]MCD7116823.1 hypothetical protein [Limosilactobacillus fastidiosus]
MAKISIKLTGIKELQQSIEKRKDLTPVKMIVAKHGALLKEKTISNMGATYTAGHSTGATARSVTNTIGGGGLSATVAPHTEYFPYLEYGTRFMSPRPTLKPAFAYESVKFVNDLQKLMK